ncbi:MAG: glycerol-3-phosphate dehydrogenase/oxidase [Actinobacteria bacterium]|nr:MAG: glycerol-3-phosphate dehydrogenase/oxidase [Actinomycetota bacterium]
MTASCGGGIWRGVAMSGAQGSLRRRAGTATGAQHPCGLGPRTCAAGAGFLADAPPRIAARRRLTCRNVIARDDALAALEAELFDLVVIGGGITGAGVALDAASRGYSVALVERDDYASGTSSRSSKLVHGGLRYLQNFDLGLVREALLERALLVNLAPHLVRPLELLVASFEGKHPQRTVGVGLNMYDAMATERLRLPGRRRRDGDGIEEWSPDRHRVIDGEEVKRLLPALAGRDPTAAYLFYDCQTDDARLVLTVLGEAERYGAVMANRCEVIELLDENGRAVGARCLDRVSGRELAVRAANVVNATGVWADTIRSEELYEQEEVPHIRPSRGTHITLPYDKLPLNAGAIVPVGDGRTIFTLPWLGRALVGTTDNDYEGPLDHVPPDQADIEYLLGACNRFFGIALEASDVTGAYAGVRPLISTGDTKKSVDISRRAELFETSSGLVTITGGKLTTWRRMAKMAVDRIVEREGREAPCRTHEIPLGQPAGPDDLAHAGIDDESVALLAHRYGYAAREVLAESEEDASLRGRIVPDLPDLLAELPFAARHEQATTLADALLRRTRLGILAAPRLAAADSPEARAAAIAMGPGLGWDDTRVAAELAGWREVARAEGLTGAPEPAESAAA